MNLRSGEGQRFFLALWPDAVLRQRLRALAGEWPGSATARLIADSDFHLTLLFLGSVPMPRLEVFCETAATLAMPAFDICLDRYGHFAQTGVSWLGCSAPPVELLLLAQQLAEQAKALGLRVDTRPFVPHVTLGRGAVSLPPPGVSRPLSWRVEHFVLLASQPAGGNGRYRLLQRFSHSG